MKLFARIISAITALLFSIAGLNASVIGFTEGEPIKPEKVSYRYDNSKLLIGGYYGGEGLGKLAAEAGIDFIIESGVTEAELDEYYANGVGLIVGGYNLNSLYGTASEESVRSWTNIDLNTYKDHPAIWGDDLIDEPSAQCYAHLENAYKGYRSAFDDKMCLINLFPIYANEEQLGEDPQVSVLQRILLAFSGQSRDDVDKYKRYVSDYINTISTDYICVDIYPYYSETGAGGTEKKYTGEWYVRNLDILAEACRDTGRDLWVITQAAGLTKDGIDDPGSPRWCDEVSDISQQAFASLAFGSKAIIHGLYASKGWWDADSHMIGSDGKPTDTYYSAQTVNKWLKSFAEEYGKYEYTSTYMLNKGKVAGFDKGELATTVEDEKADITSKNGLLIGTFSGENDSKAYIITNMEELNNNVTAKAVFTVPEGKTAVFYQQGKAAEFAGGTDITLNLNAGEGVFVTVK